MDVAPAPRDGTLGLRLFLFKFLSFFGSTLCALLLIEGLLRVYNPLGQRIYGDQIVLPKNLSRTITNEGNSKLDSLIEYSTNSVGFRGEEPPRDFDDALTVLAIGGSTTECLFLSNGKSWPAVAGDFLSPSFDRFWINNAGLDGHSTFGHLFLLEQIVVPMRPKLALFLVGINDVGRVDATGREMATPWSKPPLLVRMARHSALIAAAVNLVRQGEARARDLGHEQLDLVARPKVEPDRDLAETLLSAHRAQYVAPYQRRVEEIIQLSRENGIEPVLMTQPALYGTAIDPPTLVNLDAVAVSDESRIKAGQISGELAWEILELYNDVVRTTGQEEQVLVIDVARRLPKSSRFFYDFLHFTNDGAREVARIVAGELCPLLAHRYPEYVTRACPVIDSIPVGPAERLEEITNLIDGEIDLGSEPQTAFEFVGDGWLEPESEEAVDFRRSRGRRSWLHLPILDAQDFVLVLRARAELRDVPLTARLDVNGNTVGLMKLSEAWAEFTFEVPWDAVVMGLNTLTLLYSDTPRTLDPAFRGRNTSIALDWVRFEPKP